MSCVSIVLYLVLVNKNPGTKFMPSRGLHQRDPLSPYIFLFCAEGLSALINNAEGRGEIKYLVVKKGGSSVSNFSFQIIALCFVKKLKRNGAM